MDLEINVGRVSIFRIVSLPVHEKSISLHLFRSLTLPVGSVIFAVEVLHTFH